MLAHHLAQSIPDDLPPAVKLFFAWVVAGAIAVGSVPLIWNRILVPLWKWGASMHNLRLQISRDSEEVLRVKSALDALRSEMRTLAVRTDALMTTHHAALFICDKDGSNVFVNQAYASLLSAGKQELMGFQWKNFVGADDLRRYLRVSDAARYDGTGYTTYVTMTDTADTKIRIRVQTIILDEVDNEPVSYLGIMTPAPLVN